MTVLNNANTYLPGTTVIPGFLLISAITQSYPMVVTIVDSDENTYILNQLLRLFIPSSYGMTQANGLTGQIIAINGLNISLNIDSTLFDDFVTAAPGTSQPATVSPAGSRNLLFDNNSKQVPFQNLNNIGN